MGLGLAALGGLAKGIGQGMQYADYMEEKKAEQALREKQFALNEQIANQKIAAARDEQEARDNQKAIDQKIADSWKAGQVDNNAAAVTYTNPNGEQKTAYQPDQQTAENAAQQQRLEENAQPVAPEVPSNPMVTTATSVRDFAGNRKLFTGLNAAADAKAFADQNQPGSYAHFTALRGQLASMLGGQKAADDYLTRAKEAQKEGVFDTLLALKSKNPDTAAAKKIFNSSGTYKMGDNQEFAQDVGADGKPTGKWNVVEAQPDGSSKVVIPDVESFAISRLRGSQGVIEDVKARNAAALKLQEKTAEERAKPLILKPQEKVSLWNEKTQSWEDGPSNTAPPKGYEDVQGPDGVVRRVPIGKADKPGDYPKVIADTFKGDESKIAQANALYDRFKESNPGMRDAEAAALAQRALSGGEVITTFNPATGMFDRHFKDVAGVAKEGGASLGATLSNGTYRLGTPSQYKAGGTISEKDAQAAVTQMKTATPAQYNFYVEIAKNPTSYQAYLDRSGKTIESLRADAEKRLADAKTPEEQARIRSKYDEDVGKAASELRKVELVKSFYKPEAKDGKTAISQPAGLIPQYAADQAQKAQAARDAADAQRKKDSEAKAAQAEKMREVAQTITVDQVEALKPEDAAKLYATYGPYIRDARVLGPLQQKAAYHRMWNLTGR